VNTKVYHFFSIKEIWYNRNEKEEEYVMEKLTVSTFDELTNKGIVLVDFYADWCGPCKMIAPVLEELSQEYAGKVDFYKLDLDVEGDVAQKFSIMSIPTLLIFKDGEVVNTITGAHPKPMLDKAIQAVIG
jgi:thioredoxin 1